MATSIMKTLTRGMILLLNKTYLSTNEGKTMSTQKEHMKTGRKPQPRREKDLWTKMQNPGSPDER
jgi:hypothetical protein